MLLAGAVSFAALAPTAANAAAPLRDTAVRKINLRPKLDPPGTPTPADRERRLREKNLTEGSPVFIRIFKAEAELELWMQKEGRFQLFATYPICYWSGKLGPKLKEGDRQAPEGLYSVSSTQLHRKGRWPRSLDIGFPNIFDKANKRTGSAILIHGGCSSIGCYAMTNPVMEEIFTLSEKAIEGGQDSIPIHVFPFRMTEENLAAKQSHPWAGFWQNLKEAYDVFEESNRLPQVAVCGVKYLVRGPDADPGAPFSPSRMVKLARMMKGEWPVKPGECEEEPAATQEAMAAASKLADAVRMTAVPATPVASRPVPTRPLRISRNARANYAAARKARMAVHAKRFAGRSAGRIR